MNTLNSNIEKFLRELERATQKETYDASFKIIQDSQVDCPVDTGKLVSSWFGDRINNGYKVGYDTDYAAKVDYNTGFFRDNVLENEPIYVSKTIRAINRVIGGLR